MLLRSLLSRIIIVAFPHLPFLIKKKKNTQKVKCSKHAIRGGQNPPDLTNPNRPAPIRAVFVPCFTGSGWNSPNPVGSDWSAGSAFKKGRIPAPTRPLTKGTKNPRFPSSSPSLSLQSFHSQPHTHSPLKLKGLFISSFFLFKQP